MSVSIKEAIVRVIAEKIREYYLRGIRDARIEASNDPIPSFLEPFDAGDFEKSAEKIVWLKVAQDIIDKGDK